MNELYSCSEDLSVTVILRLRGPAMKYYSVTKAPVDKFLSWDQYIFNLLIFILFESIKYAELRLKLSILNPFN